MGWTLRSTPDPRLIEYLRDHDVRCPRCGCGLRGWQTNECPQCKDTLLLSLLKADATRWSGWAHLGYVGWCGVLAATQAYVGLKVVPHMKNPPGVLAAFLFSNGAGRSGSVWIFAFIVGWVLVAPHLRNRTASVGKPVALGVATLITLLVLAAALMLLP